MPTQFSLEDQIRSLPGDAYATADMHPITLLDAVFPAEVTVFGWWPDQYDTPCLAWHDPDHGWSATVVDVIGDHDPGWADALWYERVHRLGAAMLHPYGPHPTLTDLATAVTRDLGPDMTSAWNAKGSALIDGLRVLATPTERSGLDTLLALTHGIVHRNAVTITADPATGSSYEVPVTDENITSLLDLLRTPTPH